MKQLIIALKKPLHRKRHYDLPLQRGSGGQLVALIVGVMTYLTILALVLGFGLHAAQRYWQSGLTGRLTLEIPYETTQNISNGEYTLLLSRLNALKGVKATALTTQDVATLVGPWLGDSTSLEELPLPKLIDIHINNEVENSASQAKIAATAKAVIPSARLDTHEEWLADLTRLMMVIRMILIMLAFILAITAAVTVAATARTRLALHKDEVDLLHLIGATDHYIAKQFQRQAFRLATEGAAAGLGMALLTLIIVALIKNQVGSGLLPGISLHMGQWFLLIATPLLAGVIAMIASRFTVMRALRMMP